MTLGAVRCTTLISGQNKTKEHKMAEEKQVKEPMLSLPEKLMRIQTELKAPKGQWNDFSKYKFRSAEDILEALKPYFVKYRVFVLLSDNIDVVGEENVRKKDKDNNITDAVALRTYIKATATIYDLDSDKTLSVSASAREPQSKTGMDASQITGTASSYARKYALNGMFCIDDTKDADTNEYHNQTTPAKSVAKKSVEEYSKLIDDCETELGINTLFYEWSKVYTKGTPEYSELTKKSFDRKAQITGA